MSFDLVEGKVFFKKYVCKDIIIVSVICYSIIVRIVYYGIIEVNEICLS